MTIGKDDVIDNELVKDMILYKYNRMTDDSLFDIDVKNIRLSGGDNLSQYDCIVVKFDAILIERTNNYKSDKRYSDSIRIDVEEYICLLRQKKLKEIGI